MIISASRISTASGARVVGAHVFSGPKNQSITVVQGSRPELDDMVRDARDHGAKYSIRHFKVNPEEATTRDQALAVATALGREFGFDPGRAVMVEHEKRRQGGKGFDRHWHLLVPEVDAVRGRVLDAHWMRARHEKVSRVAEIELGHHQVQGRWNKAVEAALRAEGRGELADRVQPLAAGDRPAEAFTAVRHQVAEHRGGASMPEMKAAVADAWQQSDSGAAFRTALAEQGLTARPGDKKGVWLVEATGADGAPVLVGSLARLTRAKAEEVGARMAEPVTAAPAVETPPAPVTAQAAPEPAAPDAAAAAPEASAASPVPQPTPETAPAPEAAEVAPAGGPAPTISLDGGRAAPSGGGGGGNGGGSDPFASIAPPDLTKPGDWLRFLNQTANAQAQKLRAEAAAEAARPTAGGSHAAPKPDHNQPSLADAIADAIQRGREIRAKRAASAAGSSADDPNLDRRGPTRDCGSDGPGPGLPPSGDGPPGAVADSVRGVPGRVDLGPPLAPARPAGTPGEGNQPARPGDPALGGNRRITGPDRAARGRDRIQARRESIGLAAVVQGRGGRLADLTRLVASPPTVASVQTDRARADLGASRARIAAVLETAPWPDPADRRPGPLQDAARDRVQSAMAARAAAAAAAVERAEQLRDRVGIVSRALAVVGVETPAIRAAAEAARKAEEAQRAAKDSWIDYREDLAAADRSGAAEASRRQRQRDTWEDRSDVKAARWEELGNRQVLAAVKAGNPEVREALRQEDGLRIAREMLARREAERLAEQQRQQHDRRTAAVAPLRREPAPAMGPRR